MTASEWQKRIARLLEEPDAFRRIKLFEGLTKAEKDRLTPDDRERLATEEKEGLMTEMGPISTWEEFQGWFAPFKARGCFRGHGEASWNLVPTLYRRLWRNVRTGNSMEEKNLNPIENEKAVLLDFQRAAHHYYAATPTADQVVDWLALMQHHGAPTRLLDWTRSSYVALYFAMENDSEGDSALWAIDLDWFEQRSNKLLCQQKDSPGLSDFTVRCKYVNQILLRDDNLLNLVSVSPLRLSERMLAQQGQLLCSVRHEFSFSAGLLAMLLSPPIVDQQVVSKVLVKKDRRIEFLEELRRMNIHSASLFPGLDGFARSLSVNLEIALSHQIEDRKQAMNEENREAVRGLKSIGIEW